MSSKKNLAILLLALYSSLAICTSAQVAAGYQQCGGRDHSGPTICEDGYHCEKLNDYFSQCLPGHGTTVSSSATTSRPTEAPRINISANNSHGRGRERVPQAPAGSMTPAPTPGSSRHVRVVRSSVQEIGPMQTMEPPATRVEFGFEFDMLEQTEREPLLNFGATSRG